MRRAPLLVVADPELISSGLTPDRHAIMQPLWEAAANVRFYQGKVRRLLLASEMIASAGNFKGRGIHQQQNSNGTRWVFHAEADLAAGGSVKIYRWYGPAAELITTFNGLLHNDTSQQKTTQVDFQAWGDWTIINTGVGPIQRYIIGTGIAALPNAPSDVVAVFKKQNQLLAVGHGLGKRQVSWSDADDIIDWTASATNLAGSLTIEELKTPIRAASRLGPHIACYTEDQMALVYWIGAPLYFGQRVALDGIGCTGKKAVCNDGRMNYGMSRNGAWQTDGNEFKYIDHGVISDYFQREINWAQGGKILVARNDVTRCIEFHFPKGASLENNEAWSYDPATGSWAPIPAVQSMDERVLFDKPLVGVNGSILLLDSNSVDSLYSSYALAFDFSLGVYRVGAEAGSTELYLRTKPLLVPQKDSPGLHIDARIDEVELALRSVSNVEFRLRNATDIDGPWEATAWTVLSADMRTYRLGHIPSGTFHQLEFRSIGDTWDLDLQGIALFGEIEGVKRDTI